MFNRVVADAAQQVLRPLAEAGQENDREQIQKSLVKALHAVLGVPVLAWTVIDGNFRHTETARMCEHGDEAVHIRVDPELFDHFPAVRLEGATLVVDGHHIGMLQGGQNLGFPTKPCLALGVREQTLLQDSVNFFSELIYTLKSENMPIFMEIIRD